MKRTLFLFFYFGCLNFALVAQTNSYPVSTIPVELLNNANEVVRLDYMSFVIESPKEATLHTKYVVTILNSKSKSNYVGVSYDRYSKINSLSAKVYDASGKEVRKIKRKEFTDRSSISSFSIYEDDRYKMIELNHSDYPYTVEVEHTVTYKRFPFYPSSYLQSYGKSIEKVEFIVETPLDQTLRYKSRNIDLEPSIEKATDKITYTWTTNNLLALEREPFAPYSEKIQPAILIAPAEFQYDDYKGDMSTWESYGKFMYELNAGRDEISPELVQEIKTLTASAQTDKEKIEILYQYLQDNMRYVSVQLGIGGWQTFDANYVEKNKYGDCKALSNFMKSMLKEVGITAYASLIYSSRRKKVEMDQLFMHPYFANHVILNVPSEDIWLECTSTDFPPNYIGNGNQDRQVLLVTEEGGKIVKTPTYGLDQNQKNSNATITLSNKGEATIESKIVYHGPAHDRYRYLSNNLSQKELEEDFLERSNLPAFNIEKLEVTTDKTSPIATLNYKIAIPRYASKAGKRIFIPFNKLNPFTKVPTAIDKRIHPIQVAEAYQESDQFVLQIPDDFEVESIPSKSIDLDTEFGKYKVEISVKENEVSYHRSLEIHSVELPAERYNDLRDFYKEVAAGDAMKLVLVKKKT